MTRQARPLETKCGFCEKGSQIVLVGSHGGIHEIEKRRCLNCRGTGLAPQADPKT